jgi:hypothetical protein
MSNILYTLNMAHPEYAPFQGEEETPIFHNNQNTTTFWQHMPRTDAFHNDDDTWESFLEKQASSSGSTLNLNVTPGALGPSSLLEAPISRHSIMSDLSLPYTQFQLGHTSSGENFMNDTYGGCAGLTTFPNVASDNNNDFKTPPTVQATVGEYDALFPSSSMVVPKRGSPETGDRQQSSASGTFHIR